MRRHGRKQRLQGVRIDPREQGLARGRCLHGQANTLVPRPGPVMGAQVHAAGNRFARDGKVPGPQLGAKHLPGERPHAS
jgi:hypothetical protein